jgi:hypothetical protein
MSEVRLTGELRCATEGWRILAPGNKLSDRIEACNIDAVLSKMCGPLPRPAADVKNRPVNTPRPFEYGVTIRSCRMLDLADGLKVLLRAPPVDRQNRINDQEPSLLSAGACATAILDSAKA